MNEHWSKLSSASFVWRFKKKRHRIWHTLLACQSAIQNSWAHIAIIMSTYSRHFLYFHLFCYSFRILCQRVCVCDGWIEVPSRSRVLHRANTLTYTYIHRSRTHIKQRIFVRFVHRVLYILVINFSIWTSKLSVCICEYIQTRKKCADVTHTASNIIICITFCWRKHRTAATCRSV